MCIIALFALFIVLSSNSSNFVQSLAKKDYSDFMIYNHFDTDIVVKSNGSVVCDIPRQKSKGLSIDEARNYFGDTVKISVYNASGNLLDERIINTPNSQIKAYHVGLICSSIVKNFPTPSVTGGVGKLVLHNMSKAPIVINELLIESGKTETYYGPDHLGVALGQELIDLSGAFPTFVLKNAATDVYYGVSSDINRPQFSGYQYDEEFKHDESYFSETAYGKYAHP